VIAEAMAAGRPLVATSVGGIPELVHDEENGFIVPPRAPAAIAERLIQLLGDASLRARMGNAGRLIAEREFDLARNLDTLMQAYGFDSRARN
jgi:glycosyltransferase involved in cell wall biosynthesis